jgi:hypothetical protein
MSTPRQVILRAFNVGFGDCFLLTFVYARGQRHVLIDFGSKPPPAKAPKDHMEKVAQKIAELTGGKLHVLVATHRHSDHISGFTTAKDGKGSGDIIRGLKPDLVLQPWTEDPDIPEKATAPKSFARALSNMQAVSGAIAEYVKSMSGSEAAALGLTLQEHTYLGFAGENNVKNLNAVKNLMGMGKKSRYLHADMKLDVSRLLPGVVITVMGPPTVEQHANVAKQAQRNEEEYWHLAATADAAEFSSAKPLFPKLKRPVPHYAKWLRSRMVALQKKNIMGIVTALDKAMNNTSLILHFKVGNKSLLFPGDAQWENWQYALSKEKYRALLEQVDLYKVGHHGSLNATPKFMWDLFGKKSARKSQAGRMTTVMSTMHGVHGHSERTAVPRSTLVEELEKHTHHHSTESLKKAEPFKEIVLDCV